MFMNMLQLDPDIVGLLGGCRLRVPARRDDGAAPRRSAAPNKSAVGRRVPPPPPFSRTLSPISPPLALPSVLATDAGRCVVAEVVMEAPAPEPEEPVYVRELLPGVTAKGLGLCVQRVSSSEMD